MGKPERATTSKVVAYGSGWVEVCEWDPSTETVVQGSRTFAVWCDECGRLEFVRAFPVAQYICRYCSGAPRLF